MTDPDYEDVNYDSKRIKLEENDAKESAIRKIEQVINGQFDLELQYKENEIATIDQRIYQIRGMLDKLRACIVAKYYSTSQPLKQLANRSLTYSSPTKSSTDSNSHYNINVKSNKLDKEHCKDSVENDAKLAEMQSTAAAVSVAKNSVGVKFRDKAAIPEEGTTSRFYTKKRIIIGNTSKYIPLDQRDEHNQSTHKWMVYVRGTKDTPDVYHFVKSVWFYLHPSYRPNDLVKVNQAPFQLTRRGWGEFPVRVQLHFVDSRNKRIDVIHHLKLDRTYTGLQTLGSETIIDVELYHEWNDGSNTSVNDVDIADSGMDDVEKLIMGDNNESSVSLENVSNVITDDDNANLASENLPQIDELEITRTLDVESLLHEGAKIYQLVAAEDSIFPPQPYCAKCFDAFFSWNIGKRRAAEWQRAIDVKKHVTSHDPGLVDVPSTKQVMIWCRQHGYTPLDMKQQEGKTITFCHLCGRHLCTENEGKNSIREHKNYCTMQLDLLDVCTLSTADQLLTQLKKNATKTVYDVESDTEIDVVASGENDKIDFEITPKESKNEESVSPELLWIRNTAKKIGINLQSIEKQDGRKIPLVEQIIFQACKRFIRDLLQKSVTVAAKKSTSSIIDYTLVPSQIYAAIKEMETCDFLTKECLGQEVAFQG